MARNIFDLTGKVALVTGASSGLGAQFAKTLAEFGADVAILARRVERLEEVKKEIEDKGGKCYALRCDVSASQNIKDAVEDIIKHYGRIDILINNAGVGGNAPAEEQTDEEWLKVIDTNLNAVYYFAREVGKEMIKNKYGKIVNVGSIHSNAGMLPLSISAYCTSKGGVQMLTKQLAAEWAKHGITVNAIAPSYFESEMTASVGEDEGFLKLIQVYCPMGRFGKPEELDGALIYLASDASNFTTGQTLSVDGGWLAI
jgi:gluconate 5-dehydrogenase